MSVQVTSPRFNQVTRAAIMLLVTLGAGLPIAQATDLPQAAGSPAAGITFDDRPLMLPVQRNFQMAMLTASSELGRSCGHMEAYGWRMSPNEQQRVNQVFNNTVDRMRAQGFAVESKSPNSVSRDVTMFTADRPDKHLLFMWSAGEIGLVMVLCETSAPTAAGPQVMPSTLGTAAIPLRAPSETSLISPATISPSAGSTGKGIPLPLTRTGKYAVTDFSPIGDWVGSYTCSQGTTGGTLQISSVRGDQFEGVFRFYPTAKNPYVPQGRYAVYGEYDRESQRILINPGKWIVRPPNYYSTIIIGSFDPLAKTFSGFFQGINGCTSFEAKYNTHSADIENNVVAKAETAKNPKKAVKPVIKKTKPKKKKTVKPIAPKKEETPASPETKIDLPATTDTSANEVPGIKLGDQTATPKTSAKTPAKHGAKRKSSVEPVKDASKNLSKQQDTAAPDATKPEAPKAETAPATATPPAANPSSILEAAKPKPNP